MCSSRSSSVGKPAWTIVISVPPSRGSNVNSSAGLEARAVEPGLGRGDQDPARPLDRLEDVAVVVEPVARRAERDRPDAADAQVARATRPPSRDRPCRRTRAGPRGSVKASKTRSGGAAISRSNRRSRLTRRPPLDEPLEAVEPALPGAPVALDPLGRLAEARRPEPALARAPDLLGDDEVGALEDADVLLDPVDRQPVRLRELADRGRAAAEALEDPAPGRVREGEERAVECR